MPRYYLHVRCDGQLIEDGEGQEFAGLEEANLEAVRSVRSLASADVRSGKLFLDLRIDIEDDQGRCLDVVEFEDAIESIPKSTGEASTGEP